MTGALLERARARFLAANSARLVIDVGDTDRVVDRGDVQFLKATGNPTAPSATTAPWSDVIAVVIIVEPVVGTALQRRTLVGLEQVVALSVDD